MERLADDLAHAYLELLQVEAEPGGVDAESLKALQSAHVARIPYETLDLVRGHPPGIDPVDSVRRALERRGGYCYHLNGAFSALLAWLGVDVTRHVAGVQGRGREAPGPNANHLGLTARTPDGWAWLIDAGLGDGPAEPLPLVAGEYEQDGFRYRLGPSAAAADAWRFDHDARGGFVGYDVAAGIAAIDDFRAMHQALSTESGFTRTVTVQRKIGSRVEALRGCVLTETTPEATRTTEITDRDAWWDVVIGQFGLSYGDVTAHERQVLWRHALADHERWRAEQGVA